MTRNLSDWATWREIHGQPEIWRSWGAKLDVAGLRDWIAAQDFDEVWFCGAGTSAYIGDIVAASVKGTRSVPSTDLVADPGFRGATSEGVAQAPDDLCEYKRPKGGEERLVDKADAHQDIADDD